MQDNVTDIPVQYGRIAAASKELSFNMASDLHTGSLLKTLVASKPGGRILELGTGSGLATSWILKGMDAQSRLITIDNNNVLMDIARENLKDERVEFILADAYQWLQGYAGEKFDLIFADAIPGKYDLFEEAFALLKPGGFYVIDDMLPQSNWPVGHEERVRRLTDQLENRKNISLTKLSWSTGIIIAVKIAGA